MLWLHDLARGTSAPIEGTEGGTSPFWSPDSRAVGFAAGGKLKTVTLADRRSAASRRAPGR